MQSPKNGKKTPQQASSNLLSPNKDQELSPRSHRQLNFRPKTMSDLRSVSPKSGKSSSPFSKRERSFQTLHSKFMEHKTYNDHHQLGYTADQIKKAVAFIFQKYDKNHDDYLDRDQVNLLIQGSLQHIGNSHKPSQLEIIEFIYAMDKNSDGKLSREELERAFKRANRIEY